MHVECIVSVVCYRECVECVIATNNITKHVFSVILTVVCYRECVKCISECCMLYVEECVSSVLYA